MWYEFDPDDLAGSKIVVWHTANHLGIIAEWVPSLLRSGGGVGDYRTFSSRDVPSLCMERCLSWMYHPSILRYRLLPACAGGHWARRWRWVDCG